MILIPPVSPQTENIQQETWFLEQVRRAIQELQRESWTYIHLPSDFTNNSLTASDVPTFSCTLEPNSKYEFEILGSYETSNPLPGLTLTLTGPSGMTQTGTLEANVVSLAKCVNSKWTVQTGSNGGTLQVQMASEVGGVDVTLKEGLFFLKYRKI